MNADLCFNKPKKSEGTYICTLKTPLEIDLSNTTLVHIKETNDNAQFVFLKNKQLYDYFYDLNNKIIELVKNNCSVWFNTNMNPDLIDDYYTNTLVYDKTHGDLIKLKIVGDNLFKESWLDSKLTILLSAKNLRFYKQKFVLELSLEKCETHCDIIEFSEDEDDFCQEEEDIAYPSISELQEMKKEGLELLEKKIQELSKLLQTYETWKQNLKNTEDPDEIIKLYDNIQT